MIRCHRHPFRGSKLAAFVNDVSPYLAHLFFQNRACSFLSLLSPFYCEWLFAKLNYGKVLPNAVPTLSLPTGIHVRQKTHLSPLCPCLTGLCPRASTDRLSTVTHCASCCYPGVPNCSPKKTLIRNCCSRRPNFHLPGNLFSALHECKRSSHSSFYFRANSPLRLTFPFHLCVSSSPSLPSSLPKGAPTPHFPLLPQTVHSHISS